MPSLARALDFLKLGPITTEDQAPSATTGAPHNGVDIGIPAGTQVPVPVAGQLTRIFQDQVGGIQAVVTTPEGFQQIFAHLGSVLRPLGSQLAMGEVVGFSGFSGTVVPSGVQGAHLHYEVRSPAGTDVNPRAFLGEFSPGATAPARPGTFQPSAYQCFLLAAEAFVIPGAQDKADALAAVTGIPKDQLQAAAYACAAGVRDTKLPGEQQVQNLATITGWLVEPKHWAQVGFTIVGAVLVAFGFATYARSIGSGGRVRA